MLRPLQIFADGIDEDGKRALARGKKAGQPIPLDALPDSFHAHWRHREEELAIARYAARLARDSILRAAQQDISIGSTS